MGKFPGIFPLCSTNCLQTTHSVKLGRARRCRGGTCLLEPLRMPEWRGDLLSVTMGSISQTQLRSSAARAAPELLRSCAHILGVINNLVKTSPQHIAITATGPSTALATQTGAAKQSRGRCPQEVERHLMPSPPVWTQPPRKGRQFLSSSLPGQDNLLRYKDRDRGLKSQVWCPFYWPTQSFQNFSKLHTDCN